MIQTLHPRYWPKWLRLVLGRLPRDDRYTHWYFPAQLMTVRRGSPDGCTGEIMHVESVRTLPRRWMRDPWPEERV